MDIAGLAFAEEQASWRGEAPGEAGLGKGRSCGGRGPRGRSLGGRGPGRRGPLVGGAQRGASLVGGVGEGRSPRKGRAGPCCVTRSAVAGGGGFAGA